MTTPVGAPMPLAYFPSPPQGVWHLGPLPIRAYALFIIAGIVVALLIGDRRWEARGGERGVIYDIALWAVPFGLVGGRLYHLATDWRTYWGPGGAGFGAALRIWDGGLGIWGAVALGGVGAWIACRRRGIPLPAFADAIAPGIILAQAIGRLGNYFNQELYGRETTLPWGLEIFYRRDPSGYVDPHSLDGVSTGQVALVVQPTFLYELLWNLLVFVVLIYADRRFTLGHGRLFALYVAGYCVGRFGVELLRDDSATHIAGIRINSFTSTFVFIGAVVYLISAPKGREDPASLRGNLGDVEVSPISEQEAAAGDESTAEPVASADTSEPDEVETESVEAGASPPESAAEAMEPDAVPLDLGEDGDGDEEPEAEAESDDEEPGPDAEPGDEEPEPGDEEPEPDDEELEAVEPEAAEPEAVEPEVVEPEIEPAADDSGAQSDEPEAAQTEHSESEESAEPEAAEPDSDAPTDEPTAEPQEAEGPPAAGTEAPARRRWGWRRGNRR